MKFKKILPYAIAFFIFVIASLLYFNPVLNGKKIKQSDITHFSGMAKEVVEFRKANNDKEPYWLGNAFSGMPAYQVSTYYPNDFIRNLDNVFRFLPRPADYLFLYFFSFFILLTVLKVNWKLSVLGALSFGFSTYLIIIFGAGHNAKAHAIGYMPLVVSGVLCVFQKRYLLGFVITSLAMALEVYTNHPQMTYYLAFCLLILGIVEAVGAVRNNQLSVFVKQAAILLFAMGLGIAVNATRLLSMKQYADYSTRGKSELTINPDGSPKNNPEGLDKAYITEYSYGLLEIFNLIMPRFMGGGTFEKLGSDSNFYKVLEANASSQVAKEYSERVLTYWGKQPIVEAPAYIGAIIFFLFFLGVYLVDEKLKYWLLGATIFSILMSFGKNFSFLTNIFIDYVPLYNKFRAVSSIQVIAELCVPLLGFLGLNAFFSKEVPFEEKKEGLKKALVMVLVVILVGVILALISSTFEGIRDQQYKQLPQLIDALIADRKAMLYTDAFRSVILIILSAGVMYLYSKDKIKQVPALLVLTLLIVFDLVTLDIKYVNKEDFTSARNVEVPFTASRADQQILEDKTNYRVANLTTNFMNEARTSYFHKSIGGYHAAKMKRYQELFDYQFGAKKQNPEVLNMLNAKYIIVGADEVQLNPDANGNAWFVDKVVFVDTPDQELMKLSAVNTKKVAIINKNKFADQIKDSKISSIEKDSLAVITLKSYDTNKLTYQSTSKLNQFAVFSEIFYADGWNAYIDGVLKPYYQVNYVLRGLEIPSGEHVIEFKFEPKVIGFGNKVSLVSYALLLILPIGWLFYERRKKS